MFRWSLPALAQVYLNAIPRAFRDDGLSFFPDSLFRFDLTTYGRIHDWMYCTRAQPRGLMTPAFRRHADTTIAMLIKLAAPLGLGWVARLVYAGVRLGGAKAFNSCGPQPCGASAHHRELGLCRHNLPMPPWMRYGRIVGGVFYEEGDDID